MSASSGKVLLPYQLNDECENRRKYYMDHLIAKKEIELRENRITELVGYLAEQEMDLKMRGTTRINRLKQREIAVWKTELDKLLLLKEQDSAKTQPLEYEYFKVKVYKEPKGTDECFYELEDGDGETLIINFREVYNREYELIPGYANLAFIALTKKFEDFYRATRKVGTIIALGKDKNTDIKDFYGLDYFPEHLVFKQKIDLLCR